MEFHSRSRPRSRVRKSSRSRRDRDEIEKYCKVREFSRNGGFGGLNTNKPSNIAFYVHKLQFKFTLYLKSCFLLNRQGAKTKLNLIKNCKNAKKGKKEAKTISRTRFFEKWHFEILENVTLELFSRSRNVIFRDRDRDRESRTALVNILSKIIRIFLFRQNCFYFFYRTVIWVIITIKSDRSPLFKVSSAQIRLIF